MPEKLILASGSPFRKSLLANAGLEFSAVPATVDERALEAPLEGSGSTPEEVAQMTVSLCLPAASFLNGAVIPVDGGMTIRHT